MSSLAEAERIEQRLSALSFQTHLAVDFCRELYAAHDIQLGQIVNEGALGNCIGRLNAAKNHIHGLPLPNPYERLCLLYDAAMAALMLSYYRSDMQTPTHILTKLEKSAKQYWQMYKKGTFLVPEPETRHIDTSYYGDSFFGPYTGDETHTFLQHSQSTDWMCDSIEWDIHATQLT